MQGTRGDSDLRALGSSLPVIKLLLLSLSVHALTLY